MSHGGYRNIFANIDTTVRVQHDVPVYVISRFGDSYGIQWRIREVTGTRKIAKPKRGMHGKRRQFSKPY